MTRYLRDAADRQRVFNKDCVQSANIKIYKNKQKIQHFALFVSL